MAFLNPGVFDLGRDAELIDLSIQRKFLKTPGSEYMNKFRKFMTVRTGNMDKIIKDTSISGLAIFLRKTEGAVRTKDMPVKGFQKSAQINSYASQFEVTREMWIFGLQKNNLEGLVESAKIAAMERRERDAENLLNNAYLSSYVTEEGDTVNITGGDGMPFASNAHPREDGGTDNNNILYDGTTYNMHLEYNAMKALATTAKTIKGLRGQEMMISPTLLLFKKGSAAWFRAKEINASTGLPGTNFNDGKATPMFDIEDLAYINSDLFYAAVDPAFIKQDYGLQYVETMDIALGPQLQNEDTGNYKYNVDAMWEMYHNDYRGWIFSNGTDTL